MSVFSDLLSYHIHNSGKSKIQIAEAIGMPRTNFQKISTGARKPQDEHMLEKIMNELFLSIKEKKELWEAYHKEVTGISLYAEYEQCIRFLESLKIKENSGVDASFSSFSINLKTELTKLVSQTDLTKALLSILQSLKETPHSHLKLLVQPEHSFLLKLLIPFAKDHPHIKISHIICFDHHFDQEENYTSKNLQRMIDILGLMMSSPSYEGLYYYDNNNAHFKEASLFPNCILTEQYLLVFDPFEEKGFLSVNQDLNDLYNEKFDKIAEQSASIFSCHFDQVNISRNDEVRFVIAYGPCLKNMKFFNLSSCHFFFTKDGIIDFFNSVYNKDDPSHIADARSILNKMESYILSDGRLYILKNSYINCSKEISFFIGSKTAYILNQDLSDQQERVSYQIHEQSIVESFHRFIKYLPTSIMCYSKTESIAFLEHLFSDLFIDACPKAD